MKYFSINNTYIEKYFKVINKKTPRNIKTEGHTLKQPKTETYYEEIKAFFLR